MGVGGGGGGGRGEDECLSSCQRLSIAFTTAVEGGGRERASVTVWEGEVGVTGWEGEMEVTGWEGEVGGFDGGRSCE